MVQYRGFIVWLSATVIIMALFLFFVENGWPGDPSKCTHNTPDTCYCEAYHEDDILNHEAGVRQPVNTWSNLYAIASSFIVALFIYRDRRKLGGVPTKNLMGSNTYIPDMYIFIVLFLGLGSMWFHGSLTEWGGQIDVISMYAFTIFLSMYTIRRNWNVGWLYWVGYVVLVGGFYFFHRTGITSSAINILITVALYLATEVFTWIQKGQILAGRSWRSLWWIGAVGSILFATIVWILSQTGGILCDPHSLWQPHGVFWHTFAGLTAVFLYFYWRGAKDY